MLPGRKDAIFSANKKLARSCIWTTTLYGAQICKLLKVVQKYLENFEMLCWRRSNVINEVLHGHTEDRNILHTIKQEKEWWIFHA